MPCFPVQPLSKVPPPGMSNQSWATSLLSVLLPLTEASPVMSVWPRSPLLVTLFPERPPCPPASSPSAHTRPSTPTRVSELTHTLLFSRAAWGALSPGQPGEPFLPRSWSVPPSPGRKGGGDGQRDVITGDGEETSYQTRLSHSQMTGPGLTVFFLLFSH